MMRREGRLRPDGRLLRLRRSPSFVIGMAATVGWVVCALGWRWLAPFDPLDIAFEPLRAPSTAHWFGTDSQGRDVLSRVIAGSATVLAIAPAATAIGVTLGVAIALCAGWYRGAIEVVVYRLVDAVISLPAIVAIVVVIAVVGRDTVGLTIVIGLLFAPLVGRTLRGPVLAERDADYVAAAVLRREHGLYIMGAELLPNLMRVVLVEATVRLGYAVFAIGTLSFLGLGLERPSPDWGLTIALERGFLRSAPWTVLFPAAALASLVVAVNLVADRLAEELER